MKVLKAKESGRVTLPDGRIMEYDRLYNVPDKDAIRLIKLKLVVPYEKNMLRVYGGLSK